MIAEVDIKTVLCGNNTSLERCYYTAPFKVMNITENRRGGMLRLMLMSSSPGVLDGDDFGIYIGVGAGCSVQLHTQSYQRLFQMRQGATQKLELQMSENASFCFLPHPTVPHQDARFTSVNTIRLASGCRLIWGEVLTCGRNLRGEIFRFSKYHSRTEIFLQERLVVKENVLLQPSRTNPLMLGLLEGYTHQASLIYLQENVDMGHIIQELNGWLLEQDLCYGITKLAVSGLMVRLLGNKGEKLYNGMQEIAKRLCLINPAGSDVSNQKNRMYAD